MSRKFFAIGDLPVFIEAETFNEACAILAEAIDLIKDEGADVINEVNTKVINDTSAEPPKEIDKSKLN